LIGGREGVSDYKLLSEDQKSIGRSLIKSNRVIKEERKYCDAGFLIVNEKQSFVQRSILEKVLKKDDLHELPLMTSEKSSVCEKVTLGDFSSSKNVSCPVPLVYQKPDMVRTSGETDPPCLPPRPLSLQRRQYPAKK
jgi:hypothetical protein